MEQETIAAISTPFGESGIGIVRLSGPQSESIARRLFNPKNRLSNFISHRFHYGEIVDPETGAPVDEALLVLMKAPKTYTREDIVEIQCHGGYLILQKVLELVLNLGARLAQPGEFTRRAFLNGRIDLTQAEAVIDLIQAKTMSSLEIANQQLRGMFYGEIIRIKERLLSLQTLIEAHIDFPEEEIEPVSMKGLTEGLAEVIETMGEWISSYEEGRVFREGVSCAIIGKTNVGKSSLLNVLLKEERAIVTPIPGTTRDVIEEVLNVRGIPVRLMDTAGLRKPADKVEQEGVRRTKEKAEDADLVLLVIDASQELDEDDREIFKRFKNKKKIIVLNKSDLPEKLSLEDIECFVSALPIVQISALKNEGIDDLKKIVYGTFVHKELRASPDHLIIANVQHKRALLKAKENLSNALNGVQAGNSLEFTAFEVRCALEVLGTLIGETAKEDVLNRIFEQFCIGK